MGKTFDSDILNNLQPPFKGLPDAFGAHLKEPELIAVLCKKLDLKNPYKQKTTNSEKQAWQQLSLALAREYIPGFKQKKRAGGPNKLLTPYQRIAIRVIADEWSGKKHKGKVLTKQDIFKTIADQLNAQGKRLKTGQIFTARHIQRIYYSQ